MFQKHFILLHSWIIFCNIYFFKWIYVFEKILNEYMYLKMYSFIDGYQGWPQSLAATRMAHMFHYSMVSFILSGAYQGDIYLGQMEFVFLVFWDLSILPLLQGFLSPLNLPASIVSYVLFGVRCSLRVVLICSSLMSKNGEHVFQVIIDYLYLLF